jgi:NTE family protein
MVFSCAKPRLAQIASARLSRHNARVSLDTIIHASLRKPVPARSGPVSALVLMGGGARTAYQVGVLRALATLLKLQASAADGFPFQVLIGTSAGAINATCLAGYASQGLAAFNRLAGFWDALRSSDVYRLQVSPWARLHKFITAWSLSQQARSSGAVLDNMPLVDTLHQAISLPGIEDALRQGTLEALAVTASSYTSGVHWTFCHTHRDDPLQGWRRPGRRAEFQPITIEHLMASSAIPFLFPSTSLFVDGRQEHFGDGSMRQVSPLSPAMHLGADKVLVVSPSALDWERTTHRPGAARRWAALPAMPWPACSMTPCKRTWNRPSGSLKPSGNCRARPPLPCRIARWMCWPSSPAARSTPWRSST